MILVSVNVKLFVKWVVCVFTPAMVLAIILVIIGSWFFFQAEDGIRDAQESRGLGDVYKRQSLYTSQFIFFTDFVHVSHVSKKIFVSIK